MFISFLNKDQQGILLSLSKKIINIDGVVEAQELALYDSIVAQCEADVEPKEMKLDSIADYFSSQKEKIALLLELVGVAHADENYHELERNIINDISEALFIDSSLLEDMESWVHRQFILMKEARIFMEAE
ncbi:TerB family tellurite resistance protein [Marinobacterium marinum]|uniref:TerB family tellurite resistance protein n=1 Tax=Marinobacterium marinum TaxID=2756129 RepID=A0A7W1WVB1_9GAMM|nr:TerB family tellurite resistance protein [Marinobacterium marinum]MBA4500869.1 TerB family tellurite resistance protein [Marinobacterium marinum]